VYGLLLLTNRVKLRSNQQLQHYPSLQHASSNITAGKFPHLQKSKTLKKQKLKNTISNCFSFLLPCSLVVFKLVYPGPTMGTRNSGASRLFFWKKDQMEVDTSTSPTLEKNDQMELDTPTASLKRLIAEKAASKDNKKTKSQVLVQRSVPIGAPHTKY
jgi:hypothetical protein